MDALSKSQTYVPPVGIVKKENHNDNQSVAHSFTSLHLILYLSSHLSAIHRSRLKTPSKDAKMKTNHVHSGHQHVTSTPEKRKKKANRNWSSKGELGIWGIRMIALCQVYCML